MKNLICGHIYQPEKRQFLFRMPCSQFYFSDCIHPAFFAPGICIKPCYGDRGVI